MSKENQSGKAAWAFNLDHVNSWAYWENGFNADECQRIIDIGNSQVHKKAVTRDGSVGLRDSDIVWLYPNEDTEWVFKRMTDIVSVLNDRFFQFDLFGATEGFQFTKYEAPGGKYGKHIDSAPNTVVRKLSFTLQLSNPETYNGGDLCLYLGDKPSPMKKEQGYVVVFPSYVLHEVEPVTEGTRYSLVSWITGKPFK